MYIYTLVYNVHGGKYKYLKRLLCHETTLRKVWVNMLRITEWNDETSCPSTTPVATGIIHLRHHHSVTIIYWTLNRRVKKLKYLYRYINVTHASTMTHLIQLHAGHNDTPGTMTHLTQWHAWHNDTQQQINFTTYIVETNTLFLYTLKGFSFSVEGFLNGIHDIFPLTITLERFVYYLYICHIYLYIWHNICCNKYIFFIPWHI